MVQTSSRGAVGGSHGRGRLVIRRSLWVFWLLFGINTLNYLDRLIAVAVAPTLKSEFHLTDSAIGLLGSAFLLVYTFAALPAGALADRLHARAKVISVGVAIWSVFSGLTALARGYAGLFVTRALVGVGEASYSPASVALLVNYYPRERRAEIIGRWQAGQVLGALLAFLVAGALFAWLPAHLAWRVAFLVTAAPGLALAALAWRMADHPATTSGLADAAKDEPMAQTAQTAQTAMRRGRAEAQRAPLLTLAAEARALARQARQALSIPMIWVVVALQAIGFVVITPAVTFLPLYVQSARGPFHLSASHASFLLGLTLVLGGFLGAILGGLLSDWLDHWLPGGRVLAITVGFTLAIPCYCLMLVTASLPLFLLTSALTTLTLNLPTAALTATPPDVAPPVLRATAIAVTMLLSHVFGDIWASWAVGSLSTALHDHIALALLLVGVPALALGCVISLFGARMYARSRHTMR
ncbi:MAG TPA: MFS transporter [Ktedonobacterales bacterium]|jgi:MFS family permease|nr:MFS transporter [Ktedonobacterales bacterium]